VLFPGVIGYNHVASVILFHSELASVVLDIPAGDVSQYFDPAAIQNWEEPRSS
jgi:hypothetical protein